MKIVAIAVGLLVASEPLLAQAERGVNLDTDRIDQVFAAHDNDRSPGCAVGVIVDQQLRYTNGYGIADLSWGSPITPSTNFNIGSVSKQFTAASIAHAAQSGHLSLDDDVRLWVPELPEYDGEITIQQLIHHTSGLRDYLDMISLAGGSIDDARTDEDLLALIARQRATDFTPGARFGYSNTGYFLLSVIIERATGLSLRAYADEHLFLPLGMNRTHFHDDRGHVIEERAIGYSVRSDDISINSTANWDQVGDGGLYTNIIDLAAWDRNFYTEEVGGPGFTQKLLARAPTGSSTYAFGLGIGEYQGLTTVSHSGGLAGFSAQGLRFPDQETTIYVLCNERVNATALARQVADIVLESELAPIVEVDSTAASGDADPGESMPSELADVKLDAFVGHWRVPTLNRGFEIVREGEGLIISQNGDSREATILSPQSIAIESLGSRMTFSNSREGLFTSVAIQQPGREFAAERREPVSEVPGLTGTYYSEELDARYVIQEGEDALEIGPVSGSMGLISPSDQEGVFFIPLGSIEIRRIENEVQGFTLDAIRMTGFYFEKL